MSLTAVTAPVIFHVDYNLTLEAASVGFPIFVDPFVDIEASYLRTETSIGIDMEPAAGTLTVIRTAQRTGPLTFRVITPTT